MKPIEFTFQEFSSYSWENQVKMFITSLDCSDNIIWYRKREHKKINEELATLGYYVKYHFGEDKNITFRLNREEGKADGWIYRNRKEIESVQIAIAFYEREEADIDRRRMNGEDVVVSDWVGDRLSLLKDRVENRISKKTNMKYQNIDTLLIGVRGWFVRRINKEHSNLRISTIKVIKQYISNSEFKQAIIVDSDFVGKGECLIIPNKSIHPTCG